MRHGSLFSGIGGFDLASEWMGWENIFHCDWNPFTQQILKYYWPNAISYEDITKTDFSIWRGKIDVLTGGFPCQPFSAAGNRKGTNDDRYLWPEYLRAIREIQPTWIIGENVTGILSMEEREMFFRVDNRKLVRLDYIDNYEAVYTRQAKLLLSNITEDLEKEKYSVQTFIIPASGVGAPHRRDRIWIVAHTQSIPGNIPKRPEIRKSKTHFNGHGSFGNVTDTSCFRQKRFRWKKPKNTFVTRHFPSHTFSKRLWGESNRFRDSRFFNKTGKEFDWKNFPTQSPICSGDDGFSSQLDGITFPKWRSESIKAGGNAIVPQVVLQIFKAIIQSKSL